MSTLTQSDRYRYLKRGHIGAVALDGEPSYFSSKSYLATSFLPKVCQLTAFETNYFVPIVYEGEAEYFFRDSSSKIIQDDDLSRLISFYNVFIRYTSPLISALFSNGESLCSGHQAFLTTEALEQIANQSIEGLLSLQAPSG